MPCKFGVDIPLCFSCYNDKELVGRMKALINYTYRAVGQRASFCTGCKACEKRCSQKIEIAKEMKTVRKTFEGGIFKPISAIARKVMKAPNNQK